MPLPRRLRKHLHRRGIPVSEICRRAKARRLRGAKSTEQPRRPPHMLTLPPEIRNAIYAYALNRILDIEIKPTLRGPALPKVCRQLRAEALEMWYSLNEFETIVKDYDATLVLNWHAHCRKLLQSASSVSTYYILSGVSDWNNLKAWLYGRWLASDPYGLVEGTGSGSMAVFLEAAHSLLDSFLQRPWNEFEVAVENLRLAVGAYDDAWKD